MLNKLKKYKNFCFMLTFFLEFKIDGNSEVPF